MSSEGSNAGLKIGRTLELARKERGLSLKQVEQATKIRARYLGELERENFGVLPAVYVQGSLRTYANFLQLDGEALVRELRHQQASQHEPQEPAHVEPPRGDYFDRSLIFLGGAAGAEGKERAEDEEGAEAAALPFGGNLIYLASAAFLVLILVAVALALILPRESQPELSQIREPMISNAPSQVSRVEEKTPSRPQQEDGEQLTDAKKDNPQPDKRAGAQDDGEAAQTGEDEAQLAQGSPAATATPSATLSPQMEPPPAQPGATSTPPQAPDGGNATDAPVGGSGAAPQPAARGTGAPANPQPGPRGGAFSVQVVPGSEDLVRINGSPIND
ncbi:MAG TPA: helix-turn-helix domain-containing protein [Rubrobacteraceae bacterium]|jgi:cytoskeletal protein RodZ|nr:helix-turn-helix domain-containing protein [Rubrobacteraceae bacterium]